MNKFKDVILALVLAIVFLGIGLYLGFQENPALFGRFGSLVVLFGVVGEYALIKKEMNQLYSSLKGQGAMQDGGQGIPDLRTNNIHRILTAISRGAIVIGTLVWGFGDCFLLGWCKCLTSG
ncbi:hypothetical protein IMCC1989_2795 [gamma proteobacterium IMCC1989]|nr:hypothetical protein IMCC1989_2795 [gamma proteobacterium IMCC1989]